MPPPGISGSTSPSTRCVHDDQEVDSIPREPQAAARHTASSPPSSAAADAYFDRAIADVYRNFISSGPPVPGPSPKNDKVLYVGLNEKSAEKEANALKKAAGADNVEVLTGADDSTVTLDGASYNLRDEKAVEAFAHALATKHGIAHAEAALAKALKECPADGRDELAKIAMSWAPGEREDGAQIASRIVISGHHGVTGFSASFREADLVNLARALPNAAKQIEDIHFSGCSTEINVNMRDEALTKAFPNLLSVWAYAGKAPEAPVDHLRSWESATKGHARTIHSWSVPAGQNAVAWSKEGRVVGKHVPIEERRAAAKSADDHYAAFKAGRMTNTTIAQMHYRAYQSLAQATRSGSPEHDQAKAKAVVMLRVWKYDAHVRGEFANAYGARIRAACAKAGVDAPSFDKLSRAEALARVAEIKEKVAAVDPGLREILEGLVELDEKTIPEKWVAQ